MNGGPQTLLQPRYGTVPKNARARALFLSLSLTHGPRHNHARRHRRSDTSPSNAYAHKRKKDTKTQNRRKTGAKNTKKTHKVCAFPYFLCVTHILTCTQTHGHALSL